MYKTVLFALVIALSLVYTVNKYGKVSASNDWTYTENGVEYFIDSTTGCVYHKDTMTPRLYNGKPVCQG